MNIDLEKEMLNTHDFYMCHFLRMPRAHFSVEKEEDREKDKEKIFTKNSINFELYT